MTLGCCREKLKMAALSSNATMLLMGALASPARATVRLFCCANKSARTIYIMGTAERTEMITLG